jgi:hypothetical protein
VFPRDMVCLKDISVDTLHKGDTEDDDDDANNNNNNNMRYCKCDQTQIFHYPSKGEIKNSELILLFKIKLSCIVLVYTLYIR